jgi:hypothetical protein
MGSFDKFEIRISKLETISKFEKPIFKTREPIAMHFEFRSFEFVSNFGFRASDLIARFSIPPASGPQTADRRSGAAVVGHFPHPVLIL